MKPIADEITSAKREIADALRETTAAELSVLTGASPWTTTKWIAGSATPSGEALLLLLRRNMVVRAHLLGEPV